MRKIIEKFKENKGNAVYVLSVVFLIFMIAFTYGLIFVCSQYAQITDIKRTAQVSLDNFVDEKSVEIYSSVKNSHDYTKSLSTDTFKSEIKANLGLDNNLACYTDGRLKYRFSSVKIEYIENPTLKVKATIKIYMPYYFLGKEVTAINADLTLESRFNFK